MRGEQHVIIGIAEREGQDRLLRLAHAVHRLADLGEVHLAAASEGGEIEHDGLDPLVGSGGIERAHQVASAVFPDRGGARQQRLDRIEHRLFLDHAA